MTDNHAIEKFPSSYRSIFSEQQIMLYFGEYGKEKQVQVKDEKTEFQILILEADSDTQS